MKCFHCGEKLPPKAATCPACGRRAQSTRQSSRLKRFDDLPSASAEEPAAAGAAPPEEATEPPPEGSDAARALEEEAQHTIVLDPGALDADDDSLADFASGVTRLDSAAPPAGAPDEDKGGDTQKTIIFSEGGELPEVEAGASPGDDTRTMARTNMARAEREERLNTIIVDDISEAEAVAVTEQMGMPERLGPYEVMKLLGRGGMGAVYEGFDESLNRRVAIKVLAPEHTSSTEFTQRFLEEAKTVAKLTHPHVVAVYYAGEEAGRHFFAMEFVEGESLYELVKREGPIGPRRAVGYALQAALGLEAAFEAGILHRDVKPANLMLAPDDIVKVADFGLAKISAGAGTDTTAGEIVGSPHYMSPEQGKGLPLDFRYDIYALGASLFFLITGQPPFDGPDPVAIIYKHISEPAPRIPHAPYGLERLMAIMMAKNPEKRQRSYKQAVFDLDKLHKSGLPVAPLVGEGWEVPEAAPADPFEAAEDPKLLKEFEDAEEAAKTEEMTQLLSNLDEIMGDGDDEE